ncbi:MAG: ComEC/Rec2 family competence protein [Pirellulales bacterium]|nr:ComEC/Rec2 family competence protein [Pirellulales bacterium]
MTTTPVGEPSPRGPSARYQPLVAVLAAAAAGIAADGIWGLEWSVWWCLSGGACLVWVGLRRTRRDRPAALAILTAVAALAGGWHHQRWSLFPADDLGHFARDEAGPVCVEVVALSGTREVPAPPPDPMQVIPRGDKSRLILSVHGIRDGASWRSASGRVTLDVDGHLPGVHGGDRLRVFGQLSRPRGAQNPGERDYAAHMRADRRCCALRAECPDCVSIVQRASPWNPRHWIERAKSRAGAMLWRYLDHRQTGLAATLLLGDREELTWQRSEAFFETGTIHLLAVSGLHVGIIVMAAWGLCRVACLSRRRAAVVTAATAAFYTLLADAQPPAVRAMILVLVTCGAILWGRRAWSFNSLAAAALVILAINPADLFRVGPQLSFLATAVLMWYAPTWFGRTGTQGDPIERLIDESRPWPARATWGLSRFAWRLTLVSAFVWLITLPLVMARFHLVTPIAVVLNTLLWAPIAVVLWSGFAVLALGWVCPPLAQLAARVCDGSLGLVEATVNGARDVPLGHFWAPGPAGWWLAGFYGALGTWAALPRLRPPRRWGTALLCGWAGVGLAAAGWPDGRESLDCTFLSVGHGCAVVMELPNGQTVLYDAGCMTSPRRAAEAVAGFLWSRGRTHIDAVVLSHADADHYNALPELLDRFSVGAVYVSPMMFDNESYPLRTLREAIDRHGIVRREILAGDHLDLEGGCRLEALHPPEQGSLGEDNAQSVVLLVEAHGRRLLLLGDLESPGLDELLAEEPLDCDVVMVPHHGSRNSDPPGLAAWCRPEVAIVSGSVARGPAPAETAYRRAGAEVLHTGRLGAVQVRLGPEGVSISGSH